MLQDIHEKDSPICRDVELCAEDTWKAARLLHLTWRFRCLSKLQDLRFAAQSGRRMVLILGVAAALVGSGPMGSAKLLILLIAGTVMPSLLLKVRRCAILLLQRTGLWPMLCSALALKDLMILKRFMVHIPHWYFHRIWYKAMNPHFLPKSGPGCNRIGLFHNSMGAVFQEVGQG